MKRKSVFAGKLARRGMAMLLSVAMMTTECIPVLAAQDMADLSAGDAYVYSEDFVPDVAEETPNVSTYDGDEIVPGDETVSGDDAEQTSQISGGDAQISEGDVDVNTGEAAVSVGDAQEPVAAPTDSNETNIKTGLVKENGVFHYYDASGNLVKAESEYGSKMIQNFTLNGKVAAVIVNTSGDVLTGLVMFDNDTFEYQTAATAGTVYYYCHPETGLMALDEWVTYNKGYTYFNEMGSARDDDETRISFTKPSFYYINEKLYYFNNGVVQTGWIYLDTTGAQLKNAKSAAKVYYAGTDGAIMTGEFTVGKNVYYGRKVYLDEGKYIHAGGEIIRGGFTNVKDLNGESGRADWYYTDANGVIQDQKIVTGKLTYEGTDYEGQFYVDRSASGFAGYGIFIGVKIIKGKCLSFYPTLKEEALADYKAYSQEVAYAKHVDPKTHAIAETATKVYAKYANPAKPENGIVWYEEVSGNKVTLKNALLYYEGKFYFIGSNGKFQTGFVKIGEYQHFFDADTCEMFQNERSYVVPINYKKKWYAIAPGSKDSVLVTSENAKALGFDDSLCGAGQVSLYGENTGCVDKNGALITGFKTVTIDGEKRKFYFAPEGYDGGIYPTGAAVSGVFMVGKKVYATKDDKQYSDGMPWLALSYNSQPARWVNADGSVKTGWVYLDSTDFANAKLTNAKTAFASGWAGYYTANNGFCDYSYLYKIGGKYYCFDSTTRKVATGWRKVSIICDPDKETKDEYTYSSVYLDSKKPGTLMKGWQTVDGQKYYFLPGDTMINGRKYMAGSVAKNMRLKIGKAMYSFNADGNGALVSDGRTQENGSDGTKKFYYYEEGAIRTDVVRKTGSKWYYYGAAGYAVATAQDGTFADGSGKTVSPVFAKDGALTGFVDSTGVTLANTAIWLDEQPIALDAKGKLTTGLVSATRGGTTELYYLDEKGALINTGGLTALMKIGKKYYVCSDGVIATSTTEKISGETIGNYKYFYVNTYNFLPAADQKQPAIGGTDKEFVVNAVGETIANAVIDQQSDGMTTYTNRFGAILYTPVHKQGKKWYWTYKSKKVNCCEKNGNELDLIVNCKPDGELISITDESGKPLTGVYDYGEWVIKLSKGKPTGGKETMWGILCEFDADAGTVWWPYD